MTQEEKDLLLKDLCARLPYGVKCNSSAGNYKLLGIDGYDIHLDSPVYDYGDGYFDFMYEKVIPFLRPMSSMTEEEDMRRCAFLDDIEGGIEDAIPIYIDWLNEHHFDYRGLIEKGLALETPAGMY